MYKILKFISDTLSGKASVFIILTAVVTFFFPVLFEWVKGNVQTVILGIIMLTMGLTLTPDDFKLLAKRPLDILIGAAAQFTIMPLVAFTLSWMFSQVPAFAPYSTAMAIGIILVGCCPGGVSSNIMSFLCKGDVAYSVGMTCASTLLAPVLTPLLVLWLAGERVEVDAWGMFQQILIVTIIPIAIGFMLNVWLGHKEVFKKIQGCMPGVSVLSLACIVGGVVTTVHDPLVENGIVLFLLTFGMVFCHNTIGYVLGYSVGRMCGFSTAKKRTLSIEVGMQNAGLGTNLAMTFFVATNPMAVVPCAISCAWHSISGTILANLFAHQGERDEEKLQSGKL
ncbi:MAG: bile acid:sodium symporter family protein [Bacteroidaceae bacterium]|nr:bile acid:sodium symporter family protein [Bacteroidaceae bacterium]